MTDALNPSLPVGGSQVEIASELRGIKSRLVADKAAIEALQVAMAPVIGAGETGLLLLDANDTAQAMTALEATDIGEQLFHIADLTAAQSLLGIASQAEQIVTEPGNTRTTIFFAGGFMINIIFKVIGVNVEQQIWLNPFQTEIFGIVATINDNGTESAFIQSYSLTGCYSDQSNANSKKAAIVAFGR